LTIKTQSGEFAARVLHFVFHEGGGRRRTYSVSGGPKRRNCGGEVTAEMGPQEFN